MSQKLILWIFGLLIIAIALSGRIIRAEGAPMPNEAHTAVASTLQAMFEPQNAATAPASVLPVTGWITPTSVPTNNIIPTVSSPMLTLREATNCRSGPGQAYEIIVTYPVGQSLEITGRHESDNYWLVRSQESATGTCWLWGEYADVIGSYPAVNLVTPPPTVTVAPLRPQEPSLQDFKYSCDDFNNTMSFIVIWNDKADNESGYRIIRDGQPIIELPAGSTAYSETIPMPISRSVEYYVQAYNATGTSETRVMKLTCNY